MDGGETNDRQASTGDLLQRLVSGVPTLIRKETELLRAEVGEAGGRAATSLGLLAGSIIFALVALNVFAAALVQALTNMGLAAGWAALAIGGVFAVIALSMALKGQSDLKSVRLAPQRTARSISVDAHVAREASK